MLSEDGCGPTIYIIQAMCGVACRRFQGCDLLARFVPIYGIAIESTERGRWVRRKAPRLRPPIKLHSMETAACICIQGI